MGLVLPEAEGRGPAAARASPGWGEHVGRPARSGRGAVPVLSLTRGGGAAAAHGDGCGHNVTAGPAAPGEQASPRSSPAPSSPPREPRRGARASRCLRLRCSPSPGRAAPGGHGPAQPVRQPGPQEGRCSNSQITGDLSVLVPGSRDFRRGAGPAVRLVEGAGGSQAGGSLAKRSNRYGSSPPECSRLSQNRILPLLGQTAAA